MTKSELDEILTPILNEIKQSEYKDVKYALSSEYWISNVTVGNFAIFISYINIKVIVQVYYKGFLVEEIAYDNDDKNCPQTYCSRILKEAIQEKKDSFFAEYEKLKSSNAKRLDIRGSDILPIPMPIV